MNDIILYDSLQTIIDAIEITKAGQIVLGGVPQLDNYLFTSTGDERYAQMKKVLSDLLYTQFYVKQLPDYQIINNTEKEFIRHLQKSNGTKNYLFDGFRVLYADTDGSIIVEKKGLRKRIEAGMYLRKQLNHTTIQKGEIVKVFHHTSMLSPNNAFYHAFGKTLDINFPESLVRFYFHLVPTGSPILIQKLRHLFDKRGIFFQFKCLKNPAKYTRADAGVLYCYKYDWQDFYQPLCQVFEEIQPYLKSETPLFAFKITHGIAFGENPKDSSKSFGSFRCELLAESIVNSYQQKIKKNLWVDDVMFFLQNHEFDLEKFYLNPNSNFPYPF